MFVKLRQIGVDEFIYAINQDGLKRIVEVGVYNGELAQALLNNVDNIELYLVDPYVEYEDEAISDTQKVHNLRFEMVNAWVEQEKDRGNDVTLYREPSINALRRFENNSLDLVYIDANHNYEFIKQDVEGWWKKIKAGGYLSGHDFLHPCGVSKVIEEFAERHKLVCELHLYSDIWIIRKQNEI